MSRLYVGLTPCAALENGIPITNPRFYSSEKDCPDSLIEEVFQPAPGCVESIPLLEERIRVMRQAGALLVKVSPFARGAHSSLTCFQKYDGSFANVLAEWRREHGTKATAGKLVAKITKEFEAFRDEGTYKGRPGENQHSQALHPNPNL